MTFDKLRLSIFEAYQNEEISRDTCQNMLESVMDMEGDHIVAEAEAIRADFMGVALECANGGVEFAAFEKKAETFGDKVKAVWEKFKAWVKKIVDSIKKKVCPKKKISVSEEFMKFVDKAISMVNSIKANADLITVAKSVLALVGSVGGIFAGKKMVTKYKDEIHRKLTTAADGVRKVVDDLASKLPKGIQDSGIMKALRDILNKITKSDNEVVRDTGEADEYHPTGKKGAGTPDDQPEPKKEEEDPDEPKVGPKGAPSPDGEYGESTKQIADGNMIGESTDDFDLDAMLADLGI